MKDLDGRIGVAAGLGLAAALAFMIGASVSAMAQMPDDRSMPAGTENAQQQMPMPEQPGSATPMQMAEPPDEPIPGEGVPLATETKGGQPLTYEMVDGVKVFRITARPVKWQILSKFKSLPEIWATTWSYNGQIPGPMIRVTQRDRIRVILTNELPDPTSSIGTGCAFPTTWMAWRSPPSPSRK